MSSLEVDMSVYECGRSSSDGVAAVAAEPTPARSEVLSLDDGESHVKRFLSEVIGLNYQRNGIYTKSFFCPHIQDMYLPCNRARNSASGTLK